jgi:hypothetical protein
MMKNKPVFEVQNESTDVYLFTAMRFTHKIVGPKQEFLASDSLKNLKTEIKARGWRLAYLNSREDYALKSYVNFDPGYGVPYSPRYY